MIRDVKQYFDMEKEIRNADFLEMENYRQIYDDIVSTIRDGHLVALTRIVGCSNIVTARKTRQDIKNAMKSLHPLP